MLLKVFASRTTLEGVGSSRVNTVFADYGLDKTPFLDGALEGLVWSEAYLKKAVRTLARYGVTMKYSTPSCTKEERDEIIWKRTKSAMLPAYLSH